ncbi:MAG TPA: hypothetical protein VMX18_04805 [Candidatus Bipolaricaulota bacterium]|nr:hypothetical protein [Candidatus Bipolaricaulota bacterium]
MKTTLIVVAALVVALAGSDSFARGSRPRGQTPRGQTVRGGQTAERASYRNTPRGQSPRGQVARGRAPRGEVRGGSYRRGGAYRPAVYGRGGVGFHVEFGFGILQPRTVYVAPQPVVVVSACSYDEPWNCAPAGPFSFSGSHYYYSVGNGLWYIVGPNPFLINKNPGGYPVSDRYLVEARRSYLMHPAAYAVVR